MTNTPSCGRIVHYVLDANSDISISSVGQHRPAIIVHVWDSEPVLVQLQVFTDGANDRPNRTEMVMWRPSVHHDEDKKAPGTWHWPERV